MGPQSRINISWALGTFRHYGYAAFRRYRQLGIRGKVRLHHAVSCTFGLTYEAFQYRYSYSVPWPYT